MIMENAVANRGVEVSSLWTRLRRVGKEIRHAGECTWLKGEVGW